MKEYTVMLKPASGLCNIHCSYCFYTDLMSNRQVDNYGRMSESTMQTILTNIFETLNEGDQLTLIFQGGEPTLAGIKFYAVLADFVDSQHKVNVSYVIQTNGILIDETWCTLFNKYDFLVGLSVDGNQRFHNMYRLDLKDKGTFNQVIHAKRLFDKYHVRYNVLSVLTNQLAHHPSEVFKFIKQFDIGYTQFIPCLDSLDEEQSNNYALTPENFAYFYKQLFPLWKRALEKGKYYSIKLFDDIGNLLMKGQVGACGLTGHCTPQIVVEADGGVYPCDFYMTDAYRIGNLTQDSFASILQKSSTSLFLSEVNAKREKCSVCPFLSVCNGGCKRMKDAIFWNRDGSYCGYQDVLRSVADSLIEVVGRYQ